MTKTLKARKHPLGGWKYAVDCDGQILSMGVVHCKSDLADLQNYHNCDRLEIQGETSVPPLGWVVFLRLLAWTLEPSGDLWGHLRRFDRKRIATVEIAVWLIFAILGATALTP